LRRFKQINQLKSAKISEISGKQKSVQILFVEKTLRIFPQIAQIYADLHRSISKSLQGNPVKSAKISEISGKQKIKELNLLTTKIQF
jgi:hypothetical protein